jgi:hypothetical protein
MVILFLSLIGIFLAFVFSAEYQKGSKCAITLFLIFAQLATQMVLAILQIIVIGDQQDSLSDTQVTWDTLEYINGCTDEYTSFATGTIKGEIDSTTKRLNASFDLVIALTVLIGI